VIRNINNAFNNICKFSKIILISGLILSTLLMASSLILHLVNHSSTYFDLYLYLITTTMAETSVSVFNIAVIATIFTDFIIKR